jgi:TIR domain
VAPVQIFISYARVDNAPPPDAPDLKGFVTVLHEQLRYQLDRFGPRAQIWRDEQIDDGDQFEPLIEKALEESGLLLVVLSRNWLFSDWCKRELKSFEERRSKDDQLRIRRRIVVAAVHDIDPNHRPVILQGQASYKFFALDGGMKLEREFYDRGKFDARYHEQIKRLGAYLWRRANEIAAEDKEPSIVGEVKPPDVLDELPSAKSNGRMVYLAKPATDMLAAYGRVVAELKGRGYVVVPPTDERIPDKTAIAFLDSALEKAEVAIHLLGEDEGYSPEKFAPIAKLQLAQTATRVSSDHEGRSFRRLIWAPKILEGEEGATSKFERDPLAVLSKFSPQLPSDKVEGDNLTKFVAFLLQYLDRTAPQVDSFLPVDDQENIRIYVYHRAEDTDYAVKLARSLAQHNVEPMFPAFEGDAADLKQWHRQNLLDCDSVVLCWAAAPEVWVRATSREFKNWRDLGRAQSFLRRGLVAGPPPGERKLVFTQFPPRSEIDLVLDLTGMDAPSPADLAPLVGIPSSGGK